MVKVLRGAVLGWGMRVGASTLANNQCGSADVYPLQTSAAFGVLQFIKNECLDISVTIILECCLF